MPRGMSQIYIGSNMKAREGAMTIEYRIRSVYGEDRMYLVDPDMARAVERLTGCKTVTPCHKKALESMGFELIQVI